VRRLPLAALAPVAPEQLVEQLVELHGVGQAGALEQRGVGVIVWLVLNAIVEA
jgi:hypothetical protein